VSVRKKFVTITLCISDATHVDFYSATLVHNPASSASFFDKAIAESIVLDNVTITLFAV